MKKFYFLLPLLLLLCLPAFAKVFRVGYSGTPLSGVDFGNISQANDSAKTGDTIQIYGFIQNGGRINKRLTLTGFGYEFSLHPGLQSNPGILNTEGDYPTYIFDLFILSGADSSIVEGCTLSSKMIIQANKVIIRRCRVRGDLIVNQTENIEGVKFVSCNFGMANIYLDHASNLEIFNCINGALRLSGGNAKIINCNFISVVGSTQALIKNCILGLISTGNIVNDNNVFLISEPTPTIPGSNNKWAQVYDSVFVVPFQNQSIDDENYYQLRPNSPAKNFGIDLSGNPTDCGIFGGELAYRYKIGGQPAIPAFYKLSAPTNAATTNPYNITVSIRSNN